MEAGMGRTRRQPVGEDPEALYLELLAQSVSFRERLAARYASAVNTFLRSLPIETIGEKREAVRAVNGRLRSLGLAIRCPKTGLPARLVAHPGNHPEQGRFQIEILGAERRRTVSAPEPPPLELMPEPPEEGAGDSR
jgi:hypothetical protein